MANCARCGDETQLYINNTPICVKCDKTQTDRVEQRQVQDWALLAMVSSGPDHR